MLGSLYFFNMFIVCFLNFSLFLYLKMTWVLLGRLWVEQVHVRASHMSPVPGTVQIMIVPVLLANIPSVRSLSLARE